jgi:hypothetical protein
LGNGLQNKKEFEESKELQEFKEEKSGARIQESGGAGPEE